MSILLFKERKRMSKFFGFIFVLALLCGYIANIVKLLSESAAGMAVARGIGVFVAPLGAILGYF